MTGSMTSGSLNSSTPAGRVVTVVPVVRSEGGRKEISVERWGRWEAGILYEGRRGTHMLI